MSRYWRLLCCVVSAVLAGAVLSGSPASAVGLPQGSVVSEVPPAWTPHVLDNQVLDLEQVGTRIVVSGSFTQFQDAPANGGTTFARRSVFAFADGSGAVDRGFDPVVDGRVNTLLAGPDNTIWIGGTFSTVNGTAIRNLAQLNLANGELTAFRAPALNGAVYDLALAGGRLVVGGVFNTVGGVAHGGLATLNPTTGALDGYMGVDVIGHHNWDGTDATARGSVGVENFDLSPDGSRLVVIGNFTSADGFPRDQAMVVRMNAGGAAVEPDWQTSIYTYPCLSRRFDHYMRDVEFAPDGSFFSISTSGGNSPGSWCDTVVRFETTGTGQDVMPTWTAYSGGDSTFAVAVSDVAVYAGGHSRWLNNQLGSEDAGPGAVPRPSLAALDPRTGIPLDWNPGRHPRGVGVLALLLTPNGIYLGHDTEYLGNREYLRPRLGYLPLAGGHVPAPEPTRSLPATVFLGGRETATGTAGTGDVVTRYFDGATADADGSAPTGGLDWSQVRGAFLVGEDLYYGYPNADEAGAYYLYRRSFDGTTFGAAEVLNPYRDPEWNDVETGSRWFPATYGGVVPDFYGEQLSTVTGMFFDDGRLYYTRAGSPALHWRGFSVDSGIIQAVEQTAAATGFGDVAGMFLSGGDLYRASASTGELLRTTFTDGVPGGTSTTVAPGPGAGGQDWRTRAMFLGPGGPAVDPAPTASFTVDCTGLDCSFDATGSTDDGGTITSYAWTWGDGTPDGDGATPAHTYAAGGSYTVGLTVTDDGGNTDSTSQPVAVTDPSVAPADITFRGADGISARGTTPATVTVPASVEAGDALVMVMSVASATIGVTTPAGWTLEDTQISGQMATRVYSRVAEAGDAGADVTVARSGSSKVTLQLSAYSGTAGTDPVAVTGAADGAGTSHTTPTASAAAGSWVVSVWSDKQSVARSWTAPSGVTVRSNLAGVGSGDIASLLADSGGPVAGGEVGGLTATLGTSSNQATMFTVVLAPGAGTTEPPVNQPPTAAFEYSCSGLECTFDAGTSSDDGTVVGWAWDFGDGQTGTAGPTTAHTFATAGDYDVTLTVTDDDAATGVVTSTVPVSDAPPATGIGLRGSSGTAARAVTSASVEIPAGVESGDGMVLVLSTNSTVSGASPAGWTQAGIVVSGNGPTTQVFQRVAGAGDAGGTVTVVLSGQAKVTLQLLAYSGTVAGSPIASLTTAADGAGTAHTTPTATATVGSWVLSVWSDKQAEARQWTAPAEATERSNLAGVGMGDIATLAADSGGPVIAGTVGGLTATVPTASTRATMLTIVLGAA